MKLALLLVLMLVPAALAQESFPWEIDVEEGVLESSVTNATVGDWYEVEIFNYDEVYHNVTLSGQGTFMVAPYTGVDHGPFQIGDDDMLISDDVSGKTILVEVHEGDFIDAADDTADDMGDDGRDDSGDDADENAQSGSRETPAPFVILTLGLAMLARRK